MIFEEYRALSNIKLIQIISIHLYVDVFQQCFHYQNDHPQIKSLYIISFIYTNDYDKIIHARNTKEIESKLCRLAVICICKTYTEIV